MNEIMKTANGLMAVATQEELSVYDKIFRSTEEHVMEQLGKSKEDMIATFMLTWINRAIGK